MKKYLLIALLLLTMFMTLVACGSDNATSDTDVKDPATDQTGVEVSDDSDEPEVPVDDKDSEVDTEEPVEPDEPVVEMVDWETWATQADHNEVCMVVWNETTGTQEILKPMTENSSIYTLEEGDRFSVPRRDNVEYIYKNSKTKIYWESDEQQYMELEILPGEKTQISIICNDRVKAISYLFNY